MKPTAGWRDASRAPEPTSGDGPWTIEKTPSGIRPSRAARRMRGRPELGGAGMRGVRLDDDGTARPRAPRPCRRPPPRRPAGSSTRRRPRPGPSGTSIRRRSGRGRGLRSGSARSMRASTHEPSSIRSAKRRSWSDGAGALALEPRGAESAVSAPARASSASPSATISLGDRPEERGTLRGGSAAYGSKARSAARAAASTSAAVASTNSPSSVSPVPGFLAWNADRAPGGNRGCAGAELTACRRRRRRAAS